MINPQLVLLSYGVLQLSVFVKTTLHGVLSRLVTSRAEPCMAGQYVTKEGWREHPA
jgi:hypothetical protein